MYREKGGIDTQQNCMNIYGDHCIIFPTQTSIQLSQMEGRCRKGSNKGGQQFLQQQGGHHGNQATAHLQAPANTTLRVQRVEWIIN